MKPATSAGTHVTSAKRVKTRNRCQARENTLPVASEGKQVTGAKDGKTCKQSPGAEKTTGVKRGKTCNQCQTCFFLFILFIQECQAAGKRGNVWRVVCVPYLAAERSTH